MLSLFRWRRKTDAPKLRSRSEAREGARFSSGQAVALAPEKREFLARAAAHQLLSIEWRAQAVAASPRVAVKQSLAPIVDEAGARHAFLLAELRRMRVKPEAAVAAHWPEFEAYRAQLRSDDWYEQLLVAYLADGLLRDSFLAMAPGVGSDGQRVAEQLGDDAGEPLLREALREEFETDPRLGARMALWGRRLVGDTLLLVRGGYRLPEDAVEADARVTAAFSDLVAGHTRRMDSLGLTA